MIERADSETLFSPRRWFLGEDGLVRPFWRSVLFIVMTVFLFLLVNQLLRPLVFGWPTAARVGARFIAVTIALLLLSWLLLAAFDRRPLRHLGLWFYRGAVREFAVGWAVGAALIAAVAVLLMAAGSLVYHAFWRGEVGGVVLWIVLLLIASAAEEIAFRGYGMQRLIDAIGEPAGVLVFSALFAMVHMNNPSSSTLSALNTFLAGILLSLAYLKTRALWLPIGLHWSWNFMMGQVFSLPISGLNLAPRLFKAEVSGPEWLSGGSYGPEGSILFTVVCTLAILWLSQTKSITPSPAVEEGLE